MSASMIGVLIFVALLTVCNLIILGLNIKLYTEYFKDKSINSRKHN